MSQEIYITNMLCNNRLTDWLIGWCLMPTLAIFQLYGGVAIIEVTLHVMNTCVWPSYSDMLIFQITSQQSIVPL